MSVPPTNKRSAAAAPPDAQSPWVQLRSATFHPFIYQRMVRAADPAARAGDVVAVYDKAGKLFGRGFYNPRSQIAVRMLIHGDAPLDDVFWRTALGRAVALRRRLNLDAVTDAYRLVHAEGDGLSGLIVERYADCLAFEFFSLGMFQRREQLAALLGEALGAPASLDRPSAANSAWRLVFRADEQIERLEGFRVPPNEAAAGKDSRDRGGEKGFSPQQPEGFSRQQRPSHAGLSRPIIREHGVRYRVDVAAGHKTGFFCDQRDNRRRFAALCRDANVLDLCCYTGGFGLCAKVLGGAREVTSVDLDEAALELARENANLNQARVEHVHADAFPYLRQMLANGRQYDMVVLDPPKLALSRDGLEEALWKYHDLNQLAMQTVRPGGVLLTCSCSGLVSLETFVETVHRAARRAGRVPQLFEQTGAAPDHPLLLNCPESAYLKALWLRVL